MTPQQIVDRAQRAAEVLSDPTLQKAFAGVREAMVQRIEASAIGDASSHHSFAQQLQALREVQRLLARWITDAEVERLRAEQKG